MGDLAHRDNVACGSYFIGQDIFERLRWLQTRSHLFPWHYSTDTLLIEHNSFDASPWIKTLVEFIRKALAHPRVRVIGVCFGHQIVGRALAGDKAVGRNEKGWEAAVNEVQLTSKGKELFGGRDVLVSL